MGCKFSYILYIYVPLRMKPTVFGDPDFTSHGTMTLTVLVCLNNDWINPQNSHFQPLKWECLLFFMTMSMSKYGWTKIILKM